MSDWDFKINAVSQVNRVIYWITTNNNTFLNGFPTDCLPVCSESLVGYLTNIVYNYIG